MRALKKTALSLAFGIIISHPAWASDVVDSNLSVLYTGATASLAKLRAGDQVAAKALDGEFTFAGYQVNFTQFSGVFGKSSDSAYILVSDGSAGLEGDLAYEGEVLILLPYGGGSSVVNYDSARFVKSWPETARTNHPNLLAQFERVAKRQKRMTFFGRYSPTRLNVAAPGSVETELAKRSVVSNPTVQNIRFSALDEFESLDAAVVKSFEGALKARDTESVSNLLSPSAFGTNDMRNGSDAARQLMANRILKKFNWTELLSNESFQSTAQPNVWVLESGGKSILLSLKPLGDFTYISSIENGA